jgi:hypothetical protein
MPRWPNGKRARPIPTNYKGKIADSGAKATKKALLLLDRCLHDHCLETNQHKAIIQGWGFFFVATMSLVVPSHPVPE